MNARLIFAAAVLVPCLAAVAGAQADGKAIFDANCRKCHGASGAPPETIKHKYPKIPTMNAQFASARSVDSVVKILTHGKGEDMRSFQDKLTAPEMTAVAMYVRQLGGAVAQK